MKISAITLATPNATFEEMVKEYKSYGYDGIDIRGIQGQMYLTKVPELSDANLAKTVKMVKDNGMEVTGLSLSTSFFGFPKEKLEAFMQEGRDHIELAGKMGVKHVRIFGGDLKDVTLPQAKEMAAKGIKELAPLAKKNGVKMLLETHDSFAFPQNVVDVYNLVKDPALGICWDVCNSFKAGANVKETAEKIGKLVDYIHVKDNDGEKYVLFGAGKVENEAAIKMLMAQGYDKWLCVEWEKKWCPDIADAKIALPQYIKELKRIVKEGGK